MTKKILNLGCGIGSNIPQILKKGELTCIDIEQRNIDISKKRFPTANYICCSGEEMKFDNNYFDEIYCFDVLEHVDDLDLVMSNVYNCLKDDGVFYVEVPYQKSEELLIKINPKYFEQIGHKRVFEYGKLKETFSKYNFKTNSISQSRGISNIYLILIFLLKIDIIDQNCHIDPKKKIIERIIMGSTIWFDKTILNTYLKYIPLWIFTLPIGFIISRIFPKTIELKLSKNEKTSNK